jgi:hypothetical protein
MNLTPEVIDSYKDFLLVKYPNHSKNFCDRFKNHPESAKAEALLFSVLRDSFNTVNIAEDISNGGADFHCVSDSSEFILEVTSLEGNSVSNQSCWHDEAANNGEVFSFGMITPKLRSKVSDKAKQLSGVKMPRVLAITTEHDFGGVLLGTYAASSLLTDDDTIIETSVDNHKDETRLTTNLKNSVFFKFKNGSIEPCRRSISAILLVEIAANDCRIVGILHPDPVHVFPIENFPSVPFIRLKTWPIVDNIIETEWVVHSPSPASLKYKCIELKDEELKCF